MAGILVKSSSGFQPRVKLQSCDWKARHHLRTFRELSDITVRIEQNMLGSIHSSLGAWRKKSKFSHFYCLLFSYTQKEKTKEKHHPYVVNIFETLLNTNSVRFATLLSQRLGPFLLDYPT